MWSIKSAWNTLLTLTFWMHCVKLPAVLMYHTLWCINSANPNILNALCEIACCAHYIIMKINVNHHKCSDIEKNITWKSDGYEYTCWALLEAAASFISFRDMLGQGSSTATSFAVMLVICNTFSKTTFQNMI